MSIPLEKHEVEFKRESNTPQEFAVRQWYNISDVATLASKAVRQNYKNLYTYQKFEVLAKVEHAATSHVR